MDLERMASWAGRRIPRRVDDIFNLRLRNTCSPPELPVAARSSKRGTERGVRACRRLGRNQRCETGRDAVVGALVCVSIVINHRHRTLHELDRETPGIAEHGEVVAVGSGVDFANLCRAGGDQAADIRGDIVRDEGQV